MEIHAGSGQQISCCRNFRRRGLSNMIAPRNRQTQSNSGHDYPDKKIQLEKIAIPFQLHATLCNAPGSCIWFQKDDEKMEIIFLAEFLSQFYFDDHFFFRSDYLLSKRNLGF